MLGLWRNVNCFQMAFILDCFRGPAIPYSLSRFISNHMAGLQNKRFPLGRSAPTRRIIDSRTSRYKSSITKSRLAGNLWEAPTYQLRISLQGTSRPIWRCIQIPAAIPLCCLHDVLQIAMGWSDSHLHDFEMNGRRYGVPVEEFTDVDLIEEKDIPLSSLLKREEDSLVYCYDFGDDWRHDVVLEKVMLSVCTHLVCLAGENRCPPEDVGGVAEYEDFWNVMSDRYRKEHLEMRRWVGGDLQPDEFDLESVNTILSQLSGDSGEAERLFRREAERHSGMIPNTIGA